MRQDADRVWNQDDSVQEQGNQYLIQANKLTKAYSKSFMAVKDSTFCVRKGEVFGLLGPNGAGKTSMFNVLTMATKRTSGDAKLFNIPLDNFKVNGGLD